LGNTKVLFVEPVTAPPVNSRRAVTAGTVVALIVGAAQRFQGPAAASQVGTWGNLPAAHRLGCRQTTVWLRGDLPITREALIARSAELFLLADNQVVGQRQGPHGHVLLRVGRRPASCEQRRTVG
jgi:hypothetical protein